MAGIVAELSQSFFVITSLPTSLTLVDRWLSRKIPENVLSNNRPAADFSKATRPCRCFCDYSALIVALLFMFEFCLRWSGKFATYGETNGIGYISPYALPGVKWFLKHEPGRHQRVEAEFSEPVFVNAEGFSDTEWPLAKEQDEIWIVMRGDSFVEGVALYAKTRTIRGCWRRFCEVPPMRGWHITVMNGGIAGSDPVFNLQALQRVFLKYKPDIIIQSVNGSDWSNDIPIRGGLSRFNEDGTVKIQHPWFEPIYAHSLSVPCSALDVISLQGKLAELCGVELEAT